MQPVPPALDIASPEAATRAGISWRLCVLALVLAATCGETVQAAGFALREQSATALGNAFAGATAGADDITYMFFNPAGLTRHSGSQAAGAMSIILPNLKFRDGRGSTAGGTPIAGGNGGSDAGENAFVPVTYAMWDVQQTFGLDENVKVGLGINVPFGLETEYEEGWVGRYHALQSKVRAINVNPAIAWEPIEGLSVAAGLQVQYIDARLTNAVDFGTIGAARRIPGSRPTQQDGRAKVDGHDIGYGFNLGVLFEPIAGTRFGAAYRSSIHHTLDGDGNFSLGNSGSVGAALQAAGLFRDTGIEANLNTPESVSFGLYHDIDEQWAVMGEASWTRWSRFRTLRIQFDNAAQPASVTDEDWDDSWFLALGGTWRPHEDWVVRAGFAYDQEPIPERRRTPRIPTDDRYWLSIGAGWRPLPNMQLDFGYTHIFFENASINLSASEAGNAARGNLSGTAEADVDIIGLQARMTF